MKNRINDCYVNVFNTKPTDEEIEIIGKSLPEDIIHLAEQWSWNDTVVGDDIFVWLRDKYTR